MKKSITITITEKDRQTAKDFNSTTDCLMATAIKRRGFKRVFATTKECVADGELYSFDAHAGCRELAANSRDAPFYGPSVVGKKFKLTHVAAEDRTGYDLYLLDWIAREHHSGVMP